jgi:hypothetical protein
MDGVVEQGAEKDIWTQEHLVKCTNYKVPH